MMGIAVTWPRRAAGIRQQHRTVIDRGLQDTFDGRATLEVVKRSREGQLGVGSDEPLGNCLIRAPPLHCLDDRAHFGPDTLAIELEGEVDLLEPPSAEPEQIRPVGDETDRNVAAACRSVTRQEGSLENVFAHVATSVRSAAATLWRKIEATFSAMTGIGTCPVFQTAS